MKIKRFILLFGGGIVLILLLTLGVVLFTTLQVQKALITKAPEYTAKELYTQALEQVDSGQLNTAEQYLEQALQKEDDATYRNQLAVVKYRLKKYSEAVEQYKELISRGQDPGFSWNGTGNAYRDWAEAEPAQQAVHQEEAIAAYRQAIIVDPSYTAAYSNLAQLLASQNKSEEASQVLNQGIATTGQSALEKLRAILSKK